MRKKVLLILALFAYITAVNCQNKENKCYSKGWVKYENNPVLGGSLGTVYNPSLLKNDEGGYRMYFSWYDEGLGIALAESKDGLKWNNSAVCFEFDFIKGSKNWDRFGNRPVVIKKDGIYHMWYSGQNATQSNIGYAISNDGKRWIKKSPAPVLLPNVSWEKSAVFCSQVIWDEQEKLFKMWYSAGERVEPDAIGYATSKDGLIWEKYKNNPVFTCNKQNKWEQAKVAGCQVIKRQSDYLMFYTGYLDAEHAQIGMARSKNGIANWERYKQNPIIRTGTEWDSDAVYTPHAISDPDNNCWLLYYSGRRKWTEQIGIAIHKGMDLGF